MSFIDKFAERYTRVTSEYAKEFEGLKLPSAQEAWDMVSLTIDQAPPQYKEYWSDPTKVPTFDKAVDEIGKLVPYVALGKYKEGVEEVRRRVPNEGDRDKLALKVAGFYALVEIAKKNG